MSTKTLPRTLGIVAVAVAILAIVVGGATVLGPSSPDVPTERVGSGPHHRPHPHHPHVGVWKHRAMPKYTWNNKAAPVVLRLPDRDVTLKAWTTCWSGPPRLFRHSSGYCADGAPGLAGALDDVGSPEAVDFWFGMPGWKFDVSFKQLGTDCPHIWRVPAAKTSRQTFRATPAGPPGRYEVTLEGRGKQGDVFMSFVWTTTAAGPANQPTGYLALVADHDGKLDSYGVELGVSQLREQPRDVHAVVRATASNGRSLSVPLHRQGNGHDCYDAGSIFLTAPAAIGRRVAALGPAPFDYRVELTLDGTTYVGTARWPRDEKEDEEPGTTLTWTPPLPAYTVP